MGYSSNVSAGDKAEAEQYNNLRKDVVDTTGGHDHDGTDSKKIDHGSILGLTDDDHTQYRLESADHTHQSTGLQGGQLDHGLALSGLTDDDHTQYVLKANNKAVISFIIDSGGSAITTGQKGHLEIPFACTITGWTILADQSGSIVVDVWKDTYANFPPTVADTIAGTEKPTLSSAQKNQDLTLTTWTTAITAGDILAFNVDSITTVTRVTVSLRVLKT